MDFCLEGSGHCFIETERFSFKVKADISLLRLIIFALHFFDRLANLVVQYTK